MKRVAISLFAGLFFATLLHAQEPPPPPGQVVANNDDVDDRMPPRLSYTHGSVSFWRPGADDWTAAQVNLALAPGDQLYAGQAANFELQTGARTFVRAGSGTQLGLENQEPDFLQLRVTAGHLGLDVRGIEPGHTIEIGTPNAVLTIENDGYYRVDVAESTSTFIARRSGYGLITPADGETVALAQNDQLVVDGIDEPTVQTYAAADLDAWDKWNYERSDRFASSKSAKYVPAGVYGTRDLDDYGSWSVSADYGPVWTPRNVAVDWSPYSDGRWVWDAYYGWTWVDNAPWGWAPAHHGRWVHVHNHWGWVPGPIVAAPVYAPAVVAFFGNRDVSVSVSIGAPAVGWVALGWGEPVVPWWGRRDYIGVPSWRGWGGPRVVNRTVINNTTVVNVNNINIYDNARVRNAVVAERWDRFGRGDRRHARLRADEVERLRPLRGAPDVRPVAASFTPRRGKGVEPPENIVRRSVVATRAPRDTTQRLRAQGIELPRQQPIAAPKIVRRNRAVNDRNVTAPQTGRQAGDAPRNEERPSRVGRIQDGRRQRSEQPAPGVESRQPRSAPPVANRPGTQQQGRAEGGAEAERAERERPGRGRSQAQPGVAPQPNQQPQQAERQRDRQNRSRQAAPRMAAPPVPDQGKSQQNAPERAQRQQRERQEQSRQAAPPQRQPQRAQQPQREQQRRVERAQPPQQAQPQQNQPQRAQQPRRERQRTERAQPPQQARPQAAPRAERQQATQPQSKQPKVSRERSRSQPSTGAARSQRAPERVQRPQPQRAPQADVGQRRRQSAGDAPTNAPAQRSKQQQRSNPKQQDRKN